MSSPSGNLGKIPCTGGDRGDQIADLALIGLRQILRHGQYARGDG